eukprot:CAMPEP_0174918418 /NCGR_PEP_ID=MMETSP1355-20121228/3063_1 /TAXON_ID=464990 /ORGANISM="Hemiselmis tepida, Strain CCMP443" /LENGTH=184 /DNA_ID=CAMNT_0016163593 /DNA_START=184 /DNA_END=734 /DNA_ORIENTATION=+
MWNQFKSSVSGAASAASSAMSGATTTASETASSTAQSSAAMAKKGASTAAGGVSHIPGVSTFKEGMSSMSTSFGFSSPSPKHEEVPGEVYVPELGLFLIASPPDSSSSPPILTISRIAPGSPAGLSCTLAQGDTLAGIDGKELIAPPPSGSSSKDKLQPLAQQAQALLGGGDAGSAVWVHVKEG